MLGYDWLNLDRAESRRTLAALCARRLGESRAGPLTEALRAVLDTFCWQAWEVWCSQGGFERIEGDASPPPCPLLDPWISEGGTILYAPGDTGKTFMAMAWAMAMQSSSGPWPVREPRRVGWVNLETDTATVARRLHRVSRVLGVPSQIDLLSRPGWRLEDLASLIERSSHDVLFIDSISRGGGGDLNENVTANQTVDLLNRLCVAWVGLAHTPAADPDKLYGSVHWTNGARRTIRMSLGGRTDDELGVGLEMSKLNDGRRPAPEVWRLGFDEGGLHALERGAAEDFPELPVRFMGSLGDRLHALLRRGGPKSLSDAAEELACDRASLYRYVRSPRFVRVTDLGGGRGRKTLYAAAAGMEE